MAEPWPTVLTQPNPMIDLSELKRQITLLSQRLGQTQDCL
jgi:hypothetical protein